jgi:hypothetical protein
MPSMPVWPCISLTAPQCFKDSGLNWFALPRPLPRPSPFRLLELHFVDSFAPAQLAPLGLPSVVYPRRAGAYVFPQSSACFGSRIRVIFRAPSRELCSTLDSIPQAFARRCSLLTGFSLQPKSLAPVPGCCLFQSHSHDHHRSDSLRNSVTAHPLPPEICSRS